MCSTSLQLCPIQSVHNEYSAAVQHSHLVSSKWHYHVRIHQFLLTLNNDTANTCILCIPLPLTSPILRRLLNFWKYSGSTRMNKNYQSTNTTTTNTITNCTNATTCSTIIDTTITTYVYILCGKSSAPYTLICCVAGCRRAPDGLNKFLIALSIAIERGTCLSLYLRFNINIISWHSGWQIHRIIIRSQHTNTGFQKTLQQYNQRMEHTRLAMVIDYLGFSCMVVRVNQ